MRTLEGIDTITFLNSFLLGMLEDMRTLEGIDTEYKIHIAEKYNKS